MSEHRLQWLRPTEVLAEQGRKSIVYLPIGPLEWHGPHLPLGTDPLHAESLALGLAGRVGGVVYPTLYWGTERERSPDTLRDLGFSGDEWIVGMDFPANTLRSFYAPEEEFACVARWTLDGVVARGWRLVVVVNGHGARNQIYHLERLAAEFNARGPARVLYVYGLSAAAGDDVGHATISETAAVLALDASRVDLTALPAEGEPLRNVDLGIADEPTFSGKPGTDHTVSPEADPRRATPEIGRRHLSLNVERLARIVEEAWSQTIQGGAIDELT